MREQLIHEEKKEGYKLSHRYRTQLLSQTIIAISSQITIEVGWLVFIFSHQSTKPYMQSTRSPPTPSILRLLLTISTLSRPPISNLISFELTPSQLSCLRLPFPPYIPFTSPVPPHSCIPIPIRPTNISLPRLRSTLPLHYTCTPTRSTFTGSPYLSTLVVHLYLFAIPVHPTSVPYLFTTSHLCSNNLVILESRAQCLIMA